MLEGQFASLTAQTQNHSITTANISASVLLILKEIRQQIQL